MPLDYVCVYVCVADVCCCRCHTPGPDKHWPNKHNTGNMSAVDKRIIHTLNTDHTWLLPSPNRVFHSAFLVWVLLHVSCTVCVCLSMSICLVFVLSPVTLSQYNPALCHRLLFNKGLFFCYHIIISLFPSICVCFYLSSTCLSVCLSGFLSLSFPLSVSKISAISADCHIVCVCLLACLLVYESKIRYVPEEVK